MKNFFTLSCVIATTLAFGQTFDSFTGTGALSNNGWTTQSGTAGQTQIVEGSLSYPGLQASTGNKIALVAGNDEDLKKAAAAPFTGIVYYSALLNVQNTDGLYPHNTTGDDFFGAAELMTQSPWIFGGIHIRLGGAENTFNLGLINNPGAQSMVQFINTDYAVGTTYLVVVKYNVTANNSSIWVNPALNGTEPTPNRTNSSGNGVAPYISGLQILQGGNATTGTGNIHMDEIRMGATWTSVTPNGETAGLAENNIAGLSIFPNPVTGGLVNITSDANAAKTVVVYDMVGKQVVNTTTVNGTVNVSNLSAGIYVMNVTEEGKTATRKLVVK